MMSCESICTGRRTVSVLVMDGRSEAAEWLNELPDSAYRKFMVTAVRLAADGFIANQQKFRRLDDDVYEMKLRHPPLRLFCFRCGLDWVITHGTAKPGPRELRTHIAKVKSLRNRFLEERT